ARDGVKASQVVRREIGLVMAVAVLVLLLGVQLHRGEPVLPPSSTVMITVAPPPPARCYAVGFHGRPPRKLVDASRVYPQAARARHATGTVILAATIDEQGRVIRAEVLRPVE